MSRRVFPESSTRLALWRGRALAEFAYEPFAQAEIGRLDELRLAAVEERVEADLALGRHADLIGELEGPIIANPVGPKYSIRVANRVIGTHRLRRPSEEG